MVFLRLDLDVAIFNRLLDTHGRSCFGDRLEWGLVWDAKANVQWLFYGHGPAPATEECMEDEPADGDADAVVSVG